MKRPVSYFGQLALGRRKMFPIGDGNPLPWPSGYGGGPLCTAPRGPPLGSPRRHMAGPAKPIVAPLRHTRRTRAGRKACTGAELRSYTKGALPASAGRGLVTGAGVLVFKRQDTSAPAYDAQPFLASTPLCRRQAILSTDSEGSQYGHHDVRRICRRRGLPAGPSGPRSHHRDAEPPRYAPYRATASRSTSATQRTCHSSMPTKNGSAIERDATSSHTGKLPGRWPKRSR